MNLPELTASMAHELWDIFTHETGFIVAGLAGGVILFFIKKIKTHAIMLFSKLINKFKHYNLPNIIEQDMEVYTQLFELKAKTGAERVFIFQFHNGAYYLNSTSQMKISCTHEVVADGISREARGMQELILSQYTKCVSEMIKDSKLILNKNNITEYSFGMLLRSQGVRTAILSLFRTNDRIEGFVGLAYLEDVPMDRRLVDELVLDDRRDATSEGSLIDILEQYSSKIGFLLRNRK